ncbi:MAG: tetratricopeptide repeat protein [Thermoflexales bacterium]|nr:tetratricopeptide repeat protein [Thermoflexales bacterium]
MERIPGEFIGRLSQIQAFEDLLLYEGDRHWILNVYGGGGMGKTALLRYYQSLCDQHGAAYSPLIDFYELAYHSPRRVMRDIARALFEQYPDYFVSFLEATDTEPGMHLVGIGEKYLKEAVSLFKTSLKQFAQDQLNAHQIKTVLFFDTCEQAPLSLQNWLIEDLLCDMPNVIAVVAGRDRLVVPAQREDEFYPCILDSFGLDEAKSFFATSQLPQALNEQQIADLWSLARGVPILLALTADWLAHDVSLEELSRISSDQYARSLVQRFADLGELSNAAILCMGHLYHRFNEEIFCQVYPALSGAVGSPEGDTQALDVPTAHKTLEDLRSFQFIKYRPSGQYQLHDHARRLVCNYLLEGQAGLALRLRLSRSVLAEYYKTSCQDDPVMQAEQLYHELFIDAHYEVYQQMFQDTRDALHGYRLFMHAFDAALSRNDKIEICHLLLSVTENEDFEFAVRPGTAVKRARLWLRDPNRRQEALDLLVKVLDEPAASPEERIEALLSLTRYTSPENVPTFRERSRQEIQNLIDTQPERKTRALHMLAYLEGNLGLICRRQGQWGEALEHYRRVLDVLDQAPNSDEKRRQMAAARNNLAFVYRQRGDVHRAEIFCRLSLTAREEMKEAGQIAYSYHTMGEIYLDTGMHIKAKQYLLKSLTAFKKVGDMRNAGMVFVDLATLARYRCTPDLADYYYKQAINLFVTWEVPEGIVDTNNERACELRRRCLEQIEVGDAASAWENMQQAEALVRDSLLRLVDTDKYYRLAYTRSRLCELLQVKTDMVDDATERETALAEVLSLADQIEAYARRDNYVLFASYAEFIRGEIALKRSRGKTKSATQELETAFKHFAQACVILADSYHSPSEKYQRIFDQVMDHLLDPSLSPAEVDTACLAIVRLFERESKERSAADFLEDCRRIRQARGIGSERDE